MNVSISVWHWIIVIVLLFLVALPAIIAFRRLHPQKWLVLLLTLLGGTGIAWILALIWAIDGRAIQLSSVSEAEKNG